MGYADAPLPRKHTRKRGAYGLKCNAKGQDSYGLVDVLKVVPFRIQLRYLKKN